MYTNKVVLNCSHNRDYFSPLTPYKVRGLAHLQISKSASDI